MVTTHRPIPSASSTALNPAPAPTATVAAIALGIKKAAELLSCSEGHVRNLIQRGVLPASLVGGKVLIQRRHIEEMLTRNEIQPGNRRDAAGRPTATTSIAGRR